MNWTRALEELLQSEGDKVPNGWETSAAIIKGGQLGKAESTVMHKLTKLVRAGKAERKTFRVFNGQRVTPVPHYKLK